MANPYGWSDELENLLWHGTAEPEHYVEAMYGYRNVTDDKIVSTFLNIEDLDRNLQTAGPDIGPEYYDWVLQILPVDEMKEVDIDAALGERVRAASQGAAPDQRLWTELTTATARAKNNFYATQVFGHFNQGVVQPWKAQTPEPGSPATPAEGDSGNMSGDGDYQVNPSGAGGEAGAGGYQWSPNAGGSGEEPPPYPTYTAPATLDECWADPFFGDRFRAWTMDKAIADNTMLCLAIEQEYVSSPSWYAARQIFATYLDYDAQYHAYVSPESVEAIREQIPAESEETGDPPGDLFVTVHSESSASLEQWYPSFVEAMAATPVE